jgi:hypothetical protein
VRGFAVTLIPESHQWMRSSLGVRASDCQCQRRNGPTVLGSIPASSDTVESEGRQMKPCEIQYST